MKKTVLITGCSSGFGKLAAQTFHAHGWNVFATMRTPAVETELNQLQGIAIARLDVTDEDSIHTAVNQCVNQFGTIDVLVNNAGYGGHGMFEQFDQQHIQAMFDTNVFGPMRIAKAVMPLMRAQQSGTIINVTSMGGIIGLPFTSTYSASKFAVEGWSEGLAIECVPLGIRVKTVAPGVFGTNFNAATHDSLDVGDDQLIQQAQKMAQHFAGLAEQMGSLSGKPADPQEVADVIYRCATEDMPVHNPVGVDANMLMETKLAESPQKLIEKMQAMLLPAV